MKNSSCEGCCCLDGFGAETCSFICLCWAPGSSQTCWSQPGAPGAAPFAGNAAPSRPAAPASSSMLHHLILIPRPHLFTRRVCFAVVLRGSWPVAPPPPRPRAALSQTAGGSGSLIIPLTVHLSDKTEERATPGIIKL